MDPTYRIGNAEGYPRGQKADPYFGSDFRPSRDDCMEIYGALFWLWAAAGSDDTVDGMNKATP